MSGQETNDKKKKGKKDKLPEPVPQKTTKDEFLKDLDFTVVDHHAIDAPKSLLNGTFWDLIQYLTGDDVFDDLVRVRAIYRWITSFNIESIDVGPNPQADTPIEYFSKIQCDIGNLANLFYILCTMAEIPCQIIDGISKNADYEIGGPEKPEMRSQWNAVYVKKEWRLLDIFWAKECLRLDSGEDDDSMETTSRSISRSTRILEDADEEYFFTDAENLIWSHYPDEEKWQLLKSPLSKEEFLKRLYVRERSRELGITYPMTDAVIHVVEGQARFELNFPHDRGDFYNFKHNFIRLIPNGDTTRQIDRVLSHFILYERLENSIQFVFNIPVLGKFRVNVFANDPLNEDLKKFDMICSFVVVCDRLSKECLPLPDYPKIGWGPTKISRRLRLECISHKESMIFTDSGVLEIIVGGKKELKLEIKLLNPFIDNANMSKYVMMFWNKGNYIVKTRLQQSGLYGLKFYTRNSETMEQNNVLNYLIKCTLKGNKAPCLPHISQDNLGPHASIGHLGVVATTYDSGYIEAKEGRANIKFITNPGVDLVGELHSNDPEAVPRMRVQQSKQKKGESFEVDVPVKGEYAFNVYAFKKDEPQKLNNAYAFLVNSEGRRIDVGTLDNKTLENSKNFWKHTKEVKVESIITSEHLISIPVPRGIDKVMAFLQRSDKSEPQNSDFVEKISEKGIEIYKVKLEDEGDYIFNVYQSHQKYVRLLHQYIITRKTTKEEMEASAKEVLEVIKEEREKAGSDVSDLERHINESHSKNHFLDVNKQIDAAQKLALAIKTSDTEKIRAALCDYQFTKPDKEDVLLKESNRLLNRLDAKYDLLRAFKERELTNLDRAIVAASSVNDDKSFDIPLIHAKRLRDRLAAVRTMQDIVRNTDNKVIGEIRQYKSPPVGVHQTVMAALMLMGYEPYKVEDWQDCQQILTYQGKKSFLSMMSKFDPKDVNLNLAIQAKKTVEPYTAQQIHNESHEAAAVFMWVDGMIKEIESNAGTLRVIPERSRAKTEMNKNVPPKENRKRPPIFPEKKPSPKAPVVTIESLMEKSPIKPSSPRKRYKGGFNQSTKLPAVKNKPVGKSPSPAQTKNPGLKVNAIQNKLNVHKNESEKEIGNKSLARNRKLDNIKSNNHLDRNSFNAKPDKNQFKTTVLNDKAVGQSQRDKAPKKNVMTISLNKQKNGSQKQKNVSKEISSYLSDFKRNNEDNRYEDDPILEDLAGMADSLGNPTDEAANSYHYTKKKNPYLSFINDFLQSPIPTDDIDTTNPENDDKKCYKSLYHKRKEHQANIDSLRTENLKAIYQSLENKQRQSHEEAVNNQGHSLTPDLKDKEKGKYKEIFNKRRDEKETIEKLWQDTEKAKMANIEALHKK